MKTLKFTLVAITITTLMACGGGTSKQPANAKGFSTIEENIKSKFGDDAYYTNLTITNADPMGNILGITVTDAPESLKMEEWSHFQGAWKQISEVTLEIYEGSKVADFMFQLNEQINLKRLGELAEKAIEQLKNEKNIESPKLNMAFINFPDNGDIDKAQYVIMLEPKNGGTTFTFSYKLNGELIEMDY